MKSEKPGNVAIQFKNNIHRQERDKTKKRIKIKNTWNMSLMGRFEAKIYLGHSNKVFQIKLFGNKIFTFFDFEKRFHYSYICRQFSQ